MANTSDAWIEASDVTPMFPTLLWKIVIKPEVRDSIEATTLAALGAMRRDVARLEPGRGWQSEQTLHQRPELAQLVTCIQSATRSILRFLRVGPQAFEITGCWATVLARGAAHKPHSHPNNYLSGVYYLRTHPGADTINFHDPRHQAGVIRPPVVELTGENTDQVVVRVSNGTMLLFPSYLEHSVDASGTDEERISVSFNIMFSSFAAEISKPLW
jgi:uncharacterized protein (TIGR02466 family)